MQNKCMNCTHWENKICNNTNSAYFESETFEVLTCPQHEKEKINHPSHYNKGIEAIDIIESWELNFSLGNAIKYILRAPHKNNELEDLRKAKWYLERELERLAKNEE